MVRLDKTNNTDFIAYIGPYQIQPAKEEWQGDPQKRMPGSGKQILTPRALTLNAIRKDKFEVPADVPWTEPATIKLSVVQPNVEQGPQRRSSMWPK